MSVWQDRLDFALRVAEEAGAVTLRHFQTQLEVQVKQDDSPVTRADREAEELLRTRIAESFPDDGILGEEQGEQGRQDRRWVIDPIDGTKSFICGVPLYAVLLSYEVDGEPVVGVSHFPALRETCWAHAGGGAWWDGRPCQVSNLDELRWATLATGSHKSLDQYGRLNGLVRLSHQCRATRGWSDAYGHCLVATGRIEAMIDPVVAHYDLSAVSLIVREAGGRFTDFSGNEGIHREAISSNGKLHEQILEAFCAS